MRDRLLEFAIDPKRAALYRAQALANENASAYGVWEHVGCYGRAGGDIRATHQLRVLSLNRPDPTDDWALVAMADPERV